MYVNMYTCTDIGEVVLACVECQYSPFQAIFQHIFNCIMEDIPEHVTSAQHFSIEFEDCRTNRLMSLRFWRGTKLCRVFIGRSALPATDLTGEVGSLSRLLSVVSTDPDMVACSGCSVDYIRTIDQHPFYSRGVQSCFRFQMLDLWLLMHKFTCSVFGRIDMF